MHDVEGLLAAEPRSDPPDSRESHPVLVEVAREATGRGPGLVTEDTDAVDLLESARVLFVSLGRDDGHLPTRPGQGFCFRLDTNVRRIRSVLDYVQDPSASLLSWGRYPVS